MVLKRTRFLHKPCASPRQPMLSGRSKVFATVLSCLVGLSLLGRARTAYSCSSKADCNYDGCANRRCSRPATGSSFCNNNVSEYGCSYGSTDYYYHYGCIFGATSGRAAERWYRSSACPDPTLCAPGNYSANGKNYLGDGACKPCIAGTFSSSAPPQKERGSPAILAGVPEKI